MNKHEQITALEQEIAEKQRELEQLRKTFEYVVPGDKVRILRDYEWVCTAGTIMVVDHVSADHIHCTFNGNRSGGWFWIGNGDYVKVENE